MPLEGQGYTKTKATIGSWKRIYEDLSSIHSSIEEAEKGLTPQGSLDEALLKLNALKESMTVQTSYQRKDSQKSSFTTKQDDTSIKVTPSYEKRSGAMIVKASVPNIGTFNTNRQFTIINNLIESINYPLVEKEKTVKQLATNFTTLKEAIKTLADAVVATVDSTVVDNYIDKAKDQGLVQAAEEDLKDIPEDMQDAAKYIAELQRSGDADKSTTRDIVSMTQIVQKNNNDLAKMQRHIKNAILGEDDEAFTVLRGPVITDSQLDIKRLASGNISYDTVFYPGAKRAIGSSIGSSAKEPTPRNFILRDQLLVAIMLDSEKRFQLKLNKTPLNKKIKRSDEDFKRLRGDVVDLLSQKLNYGLVDVTAQREPPYFTSPKFPRIRFIWILRQSTYNRLGNFQVGGKTGLPF